MQHVPRRDPFQVLRELHHLLALQSLNEVDPELMTVHPGLETCSTPSIRPSVPSISDTESSFSSMRLSL